MRRFFALIVILGVIFVLIAVGGANLPEGNLVREASDALRAIGSAIGDGFGGGYGALVGT